jgi:ribonuclease E
MSRQRIRTSVLESSTEKCPVCGGSGHVRSVSSVALQCLRAVEEMLNKGATHNLIVRTRSEVALYMLNHKRAHLRALEERFRIVITVSADAAVNAQQSYIVDRGEQVHTPEAARALAAQTQSEPTVPEDEEAEVFAAEEEEFAAEAEGEEAQASEAGETEGEPREGGEHRRRRRRRGRGRGRGRDEGREPREAQAFAQDAVGEQAVAHEDHDTGSPEEEGFGEQPREARGEEGAGENGERRRRRRGRRGGRRNRARNGEGYQGGNGHDRSEDAAFEQGVHETSGGAPHPVISDEDAMVMAPRFEEPVHPVHNEPAAQPAIPAPVSESAPEPTPTRRRSTIREPAPIVTSEEVMPPPAPSVETPPAAPVISTSGEEPSTPKRGWWGRRLLGDKN